MYRPAIMGLLFCASILLGSVFYVYLAQINTQVKSDEPKVFLDLNEDEPDDFSDLGKYLEEFDCELLREEHGWYTSDQAY